MAEWKREPFSFPSTDGVHEIHATLTLPEGEPLGVVQLIHGMLDHSERYTELAGAVTGAGFAFPAAIGFSICSSMVFHSPQAAQRPCHLGDSLPQLVQKNTVFAFAIGDNSLVTFIFYDYINTWLFGQVFENNKMYFILCTNRKPRLR